MFVNCWKFVSQWSLSSLYVSLWLFCWPERSVSIVQVRCYSSQPGSFPVINGSPLSPGWPAKRSGLTGNPTRIKGAVGLGYCMKVSLCLGLLNIGTHGAIRHAKKGGENSWKINAQASDILQKWISLTNRFNESFPSMQPASDFKKVAGGWAGVGGYYPYKYTNRNSYSEAT